MTQMQDYDIVGSFNNQRYTNINAERTVNLFEYIDESSKKRKTLLPTSGLYNTDINFPSASGGVRAEFVFKDGNYLVVGENVYKVNSSSSASKINTDPLQTTTGYVGIEANNREVGNQIMFVDGRKGYVWDADNSIWEQVTDPAFPPNPIDVTNLDGFLTVANGGTNSFQLSSFNNALIWGSSTTTFTASSATDLITLSSSDNFATGIPVTLSTTGSLPVPLAPNITYYCIRINLIQIKLATSFANAIAGTAIDLATNGTGTQTIDNAGQLQQGFINSHPGNIVACRTLHRLLFLFSDTFCEVWENAGLGTNLPFRRNNSLLMEYGLAALGSLRVGFDRMFFLSQDKDGLGAVMMVTGSQAIPISNRALDFQLAQYASDPGLGVDDGQGILIKENGLIFYRLNFTNANHTYVYNDSMSDLEHPRWHEEEVLNGDRHPAQTHGYFNGVNYYGHYALPILYIVDDIYGTNGEVSNTFTADIATNELILSHTTNYFTGYPVTFTSTASLPGGIDRYTTYYVINISTTRLKLAYTYTDAIQGKYFELTSDGSGTQTITYEGEAIRRMRIGKPVVAPGYQRIRCDRFHIDLRQGQVDNAQDNVAPEVFLSISKDGGQSYIGSLKAPMGQIGERTFRTVWRKLPVIPRGQAFVPKIEYFNKKPFVCLGAAWASDILPE